MKTVYTELQSTRQDVVQQDTCLYKRTTINKCTDPSLEVVAWTKFYTDEPVSDLLANVLEQAYFASQVVAMESV